ncbi:MAG: hypothetical protein ACPGXZ_05510 [Saprospiraceae bacterium]
MKYSWLVMCFLLLIGCQEVTYLNEEPISIEARYMRYACGDWNDDMQVKSVSDSAYSILVGQDIDPVFVSGMTELAELFNKNETEAFGFSFELTGYISSMNLFGCDTNNPRFHITEIKRLDGSAFLR